MVLHNVWNVYSEIAGSAYASGRHELGEKISIAANQQAECLSAPDSDFAVAVSNLADVYRQNNNFPKIESLWKSVLNAYIEMFGNNDPRLLQPMDALADVYVSQRKFKQAEYYLKKSLSLNENLSQDCPEKLVSSLKKLADLYLSWGRQKQARVLLKRAFKLDSF